MTKYILYVALIRGAFANSQVRVLWHGRAVSALDTFGNQKWIVVCGGLWIGTIYAAKLLAGMTIAARILHLIGLKFIGFEI